MNKVYMVFGAYDYEFPSEFEAFESFKDAEAYRKEAMQKAYQEGHGSFINYSVREFEVHPSSSTSKQANKLLNADDLKGKVF